jgi:hypothetical protein
MLRNDFLTSCMRRPPSVCLAKSAPLLALARLPAALRNRRVLPPEWEHQMRLLEA